VRLFDRSYTTENNIFYVDCSGIHDSLIPTLDNICQQICSYVATDAGERSVRFHRDMKVILEVRHFLIVYCSIVVNQISGLNPLVAILYITLFTLCCTRSLRSGYLFTNILCAG